MIDPKKAKTFRNYMITALSFEVLAFICLLTAGAMALANAEYYSNGLYRFSYVAYEGGIIEIVGAVICIVIIILSSVILSGKTKKVKGIAVSNIAIGAIVLIFSVVGHILLLGVSYDYVQFAGLIPGTIALCSAIISLVFVATWLGTACPKKKATVKPKISAGGAAAALRDYKILHDSGLLTDREFEEQKAKILRQLGL